MTTKVTYPAIMLPGPIMAAYEIRISSSTTTWNGKEISRTASFKGNGNPNQIIDYLNENYTNWHPFLGCEISIDYGKGPIKRILDESFGVMFLVQ